MTNFTSQALTAVAAVILTISSIGAIVTVPPAHASSAVHTAELA